MRERERERRAGQSEQAALRTKPERFASQSGQPRSMLPQVMKEPASSAARIRFARRPNTARRTPAKPQNRLPALEQQQKTGEEQECRDGDVRQEPSRREKADELRTRNEPAPMTAPVSENPAFRRAEQGAPPSLSGRLSACPARAPTGENTLSYPLFYSRPAARYARREQAYAAASCQAAAHL